jgi:hypothetical protein
MMLVWATEFRASEGKTADDLIPIAKEWLVESPHFDWRYEDFASEEMNELTTYGAGHDTLMIGKAELDGHRWVGFRHAWFERGEREWTTEVVAHEQGDVLWISIRLNCDVLQPGIELPTPNKPYLVKLLLERLGGGFDSLLPIGDVPVMLQEDEVDLAARLMVGTAKNRLPVVYVSVGRRPRYSVHIKLLARQLAGMAHVVVEPSRHFSFALSRNVGGSNAYGGAVSVYWPDGAGEQTRFMPGQFNSTKELERTIVEVVRKALTYIRPEPAGTWSHLREVISRSRIEALKAAGSTAVDEYIEEFGVELQAKDERIQSAEREIGRLSAEIRRLEALRGHGDDGTLASGHEQEYYPGELRDALVHALSIGRQSLAPSSRWHHLVNDILEVNPPSESKEVITGAIKDSLSKMTKFGPAERKILEDAGFTVTDAGKHAKAIFYDDDRYVFSIPKTPGDHRSGKNLVSDITKTIFG